MSLRVKIRCDKDPHIERYFEYWAPGGVAPTQDNPTWERQLNAQLAAIVDAQGPDLSDEKLAAIKANWDRLLVEEAKCQEWYDYEVIGDGKITRNRRVIRDWHGSPKLLVPTVEVIDA